MRWSCQWPALAAGASRVSAAWANSKMPGGEAAVVALRQAGSAAKEGELEARRRRFGAAEPTGRVPPLGAGPEMRAMVAREDERAALTHVIVGACVQRQGGSQRGLQQTTAQRAHQSSLTDITAAPEAALRAHSAAVATPADITASASRPRRDQGSTSSIVQ